MTALLTGIGIGFWPVSGIVCHIVYCCKDKTWCGTPIWQEPSTYLMFFPAMIMGPTYPFWYEIA